MKRTSPRTYPRLSPGPVAGVRSVPKPKSRDLPPFLKPLFDANKLTVKSGTEANPKNDMPLSLTDPRNNSNPRYFEELNEFNDKLSPSQQELSKFVLSQLAASPGFKGINLYERPVGGPSVTAGAYNFGNKDINFNRLQSSYYGTFNPVIGLMHEGTHALDDSDMKTYQKGAMGFLNKHIVDKTTGAPIPIMDPANTGDWYTGAQNILGNNDFLTKYPFLGNPRDTDNAAGGHKAIAQDFQDYKQARAKSIPPLNSITYQDIYNQLSRPGAIKKPPGDYPDKKGVQYSYNGDDAQFAQLSEFPAFMVEGLGTSFNVPWVGVAPHATVDTRQGYSNLGRKFLKKIVNDTYLVLRLWIQGLILIIV